MSTPTLDHRLEDVDSVVKITIAQMLERAEFGKKKYGTDLDRTDLSTIDWIEHSIQEQMDNLLYMQRVKQDLIKKAEMESREAATNNPPQSADPL